MSYAVPHMAVISRYLLGGQGLGSGLGTVIRWEGFSMWGVGEA